VRTGPRTHQKIRGLRRIDRRLGSSSSTEFFSNTAARIRSIVGITKKCRTTSRPLVPMQESGHCIRNGDAIRDARLDEGTRQLVQCVRQRRNAASVDIDWGFHCGVPGNPSVQRRQRQAVHAFSRLSCCCVLVTGMFLIARWRA